MNIKESHKALLKDIEEQISSGNTSINKLERFMDYKINKADYYNEEEDMEQLEFRPTLERIYISICLLLESLELPLLLRDFKANFKKFNGNLTGIYMLPAIGAYHNDVLGFFWQYYKTLSSLLGVTINETDEFKQRALFESILQNTSKIVYDRNIQPINEADVRKCVYELLIHVFPDTIREIPISQVTKTYKPDIGVRSLKAAAEYKYAVSIDEAKKIIGGFYEDMRGYAGNEDWKYFYAVIYMTEPFFTIQQIQSEFSHVKADKNWIPILVYGIGNRKRIGS